MPEILTYQDFFSPSEVRVYRRVKAGAMMLSTIAREIAAEMVGGVVGDGKRSHKEFVRTSDGLYRMCFGPNADNTTERAAHQRMGAVRIVMGDRDQMLHFFWMHGFDNPEHTYNLWLWRVREEMNREA